jgi:hypothetical protein
MSLFKSTKESTKENIKRSINNNMLKVAYAYLTTWQGVSIGAYHYYMSLNLKDNNNGKQRIDITHKLSDEEVRELNAQEYRINSSMSFRYKVGDDYSGFWTKEQAVKQAIDYFIEHKYDQIYDLLILGNPMVLSIQECLWAKNQLFKMAINIRYDHKKEIDSQKKEDEDNEYEDEYNDGQYQFEIDAINKDYRNIIMFGKL